MTDDDRGSVLYTWANYRYRVYCKANRWHCKKFGCQSVRRSRNRYAWHRATSMAHGTYTISHVPPVVPSSVLIWIMTWCMPQSRKRTRERDSLNAKKWGTSAISNMINHSTMTDTDANMDPHQKRTNEGIPTNSYGWPFVHSAGVLWFRNSTAPKSALFGANSNGAMQAETQRDAPAQDRQLENTVKTITNTRDQNELRTQALAVVNKWISTQGASTCGGQKTNDGPTVPVKVRLQSGVNLRNLFEVRPFAQE